MLGSLLAGQGRRVQAARVLARTAKLDGGHHALVVLARMRRDQGELEAACRHLRAALPRLESPLRRRVAAWERLWRTDLVLRGRKRRLQVHPLRIYLPEGAGPGRAGELQKLCRRGCRAAERTTGLRVRQNVEVVFSSPAELRSLGGPGWASGLYYDGVVRVIHRPGKGKEMEAVLAHEFTHALLARLGSGIPAWLHEGMAQLAQGRDPREAIARLRRSGARLLPLADLTASFTRMGSAGRAARAYAQSLALTWHLTQKGRGGCRSLLLCLRGEEEGRWSERIAHWAGAPVAEMLGDLARAHRLQPPPALASPGR
jgi:hypothetical protein